MIQQHLLQQQRLNNNHERLLERYTRVPNPKMSEFRPFGTSSLPGRNYDQYLARLNHGNGARRNSLAEQSRASIGSSSETYRLMGDGRKDILPNTVSTKMQNMGQNSKPLVHAEKFEPVHIYDHPTFGPTPAYLRPIHADRIQTQEIEEVFNDSDDEQENFDTRSRISVNSTVKTNKNNNDNDESKPPLGYISYRDWKKKYEHLIPVNPLLFNIYTRRPNGSLQKYGQSLYAASHHHRPSHFDNDDDGDDLVSTSTTTTSDFDTVTLDIPRKTSISSKQDYNRLQSQLPTSTNFPRALSPIRPTNESSDEESNSFDSPMSFLSKKQEDLPTSTSIKPSINPPRIMTPSLNASLPKEIDTISIKSARSTANIPSAPSVHSSIGAPALSSTSTPQYEKPASVVTSTSVPIAPPLPNYLKPAQQTSTSASALPPLASTKTEITGSKGVTFGGASNNLTANDDVSSSSDTDDEEKQKRRRRRKRQAAGKDSNGSSSSDD